MADEESSGVLFCMGEVPVVATIDVAFLGPGARIGSVQCIRCGTDQIVAYWGIPDHDRLDEEVRCRGCGEWFSSRDWLPPHERLPGIIEVRTGPAPGKTDIEVWGGNDGTDR